jgi:hypothetical protein
MGGWAVRGLCEQWLRDGRETKTEPLVNH